MKAVFRGNRINKLGQANNSRNLSSTSANAYYRHIHELHATHAKQIPFSPAPLRLWAVATVTIDHHDNLRSWCWLKGNVFTWDSFRAHWKEQSVLRGDSAKLETVVDPRLLPTPWPGWRQPTNQKHIITLAHDLKHLTSRPPGKKRKAEAQILRHRFHFKQPRQ